MTNILFVHQSSDLYGSDKVMLSLAKGARDAGGQVLVLLPGDGPLSEALANLNIPYLFTDVIKISRSTFGFAGVTTLIRKFFIHDSLLIRELSSYKFDLVYSNTLAIFLGIKLSWCLSLPHVWHIHEIIKKPYFVSLALRCVVNFFSDGVIANSAATANWLKLPLFRKHSAVVWNGVPDMVSSYKQDVEVDMPLNNSLLSIGLVGRINKWKGHFLLVEALEILYSRDIKNFQVIFVGSPPPNQNYYLDDLIARVNSSLIKNHVKIIDFSTDIFKYYREFDLVCVPSIEPEPFGLVAIEAMVAAKPVIASRFGGVAEVVIDGETGLLFEPLSALDLARKIEYIYMNRIRAKEMGASGRLRYQAEFSESSMIRKILFLCKKMQKNA